LDHYNCFRSIKKICFIGKKEEKVNVQSVEISNVNGGWEERTAWMAFAQCGDFISICRLESVEWKTLLPFIVIANYSVASRVGYAYR